MPTLKHGPEGKHSVIVIGAGASGLAAAQLIQEEVQKEATLKSKWRLGRNSGSSSKNKSDETNETSHHSILVLEARDRIGGRIYPHIDNSQDPPVRIDLGATWVHGCKKSGQPIARMAAKLGEKLIPDFTNMNVYTVNDEGIVIVVPEEELRMARNRFYQTLKKAKVCGKRVTSGTADNMSLKKAIEMVDPDILKDPITHFLFKMNIEFDIGGPLETMSSTHFDNDEEFGDDFIPLNGYKPLVDEFARGLDIQCSVVAQIVRYDLDGVQVETNQGVYKADRVICTAPLGVLKSGALRFEPGLSESKRVAIDRLGWGTINKVGLLFDRTLWPQKVKGFGVAWEDSPYTYIINKYAFTGTPMLEAYAVGNRAIKMGEKSDQEVVNDLLSVVGTIFGCDEKTLRAALVKPYIQRWEKEEFTRGGYTYSSPRTREVDYEAFETSQLKVLFFAGEHASTDYRGTVHGAYLSGRLAAREVLKTLK